jgi:dihydroorotase
MVARPSSSPSRSVVAIRGARLVDPAAGLDVIGDVVVDRGRIARLGPGAATADVCSAEETVVVDGTQRWLVPAFVELHAHLREPGQEHKEDIESGLRAAGAGGYAHVCAMPNTTPVNDCRAVTELMLTRARACQGPALHPIAAVTKGQHGQELTAMGSLRRAGAVAVSDDGRAVMSSAVMLEALRSAREHDLVLIQHAEDHGLTRRAEMHEGDVSKRLGLRGWPRCAEDAIVARDIALAEATGGRYHVAHASTEGTVRLVREGKSRGLAVSAEVTPHHLMLTHEALEGCDPVYKVNPPLRERRDVEAVRQALAEGVIDAIATDHAPHAAQEKQLPFSDAPPGMIGLELTVPVLLELVRNGTLSLERFVDALTQAPARIIGLDPPALREGEVAELTLINPNHAHTIRAERLHSKSRNSPFVGTRGVASVELTMAGGAIVYRRSGETVGLAP